MMCHDEIERHRTQAYADGWLVHAGVAAQLGGVSRIRVIALDGTAWLLADDGTKHRFTMADYDPIINDLLSTGETT